MSKPEALAHPPFVLGNYSLVVRCKYRHNPPGGITFNAPDRDVARRKARDAGWILHQDGSATCPACREAVKR